MDRRGAGMHDPRLSPKSVNSLAIQDAWFEGCLVSRMPDFRDTRFHAGIGRPSHSIRDTTSPPDERWRLSNFCGD